jgi:ABC-type sugar transport system ATPase subunit
MTVCNRILVLSGRKLVREFKRGEWSEKEILSAAFEEFTPGQAAAGAGR